MKIYVASRFKNAGLVKAFSTKLMTLVPKYECIQTWTDEADKIAAGELGCPAWQAAEQDLKELDEADAIIVLTENCEQVPGGMHFETGYAYAKGKRVIVIGPETHVFHHIPRIHHHKNVQAFFIWVMNLRSAARL